VICPHTSEFVRQQYDTFSKIKKEKKITLRVTHGEHKGVLQIHAVKNRWIKKSSAFSHEEIETK